MAFFGGQKKPARWELADEFSPPGTFYEPEVDFDPAGDFDPQGSYTGVPAGGGDPVQDADDL